MNSTEVANAIHACADRIFQAEEEPVMSSYDVANLLRDIACDLQMARFRPNDQAG